MVSVCVPRVQSRVGEQVAVGFQLQVELLAVRVDPHPVNGAELSVLPGRAKATSCASIATPLSSPFSAKNVAS